MIDKKKVLHVAVEQMKTTVEDTGRISGLLAIPRISRNGRFYLPEELEKANGLTVPVFWDHRDTETPIGSVNLKYDPDNMTVTYEGTVTQATIDTIKAIGKVYTSLGATYENDPNDEGQHVCGNQACYFVPRGLTWKEMSLVTDAGIPETTVILNEKCVKCRDNKIKENNKHGHVFLHGNKPKLLIECDCEIGKPDDHRHSFYLQDGTQIYTSGPISYTPASIGSDPVIVPKTVKNPYDEKDKLIVGDPDPTPPKPLEVQVVGSIENYEEIAKELGILQERLKKIVLFQNNQ